MADINITDDGVRAEVEANTDAGEDFIDAWVGGVLAVIDVGRIVIHTEVIHDFIIAAQQQNVTVEAEFPED